MVSENERTAAIHAKSHPFATRGPRQKGNFRPVSRHILTSVLALTSGNWVCLNRDPGAVLAEEPG